jgi:hypothetical protein
MFLDRSSESLNEYQHCGHLIIVTLLWIHLMCLDRSPELLIEYKHWTFDVLEFVVHTLNVS